MYDLLHNSNVFQYRTLEMLLPHCRKANTIVPTIDLSQDLKFDVPIVVTQHSHLDMVWRSIYMLFSEHFSLILEIHLNAKFEIKDLTLPVI
jgi:hypothetical protein